MRISVKLENTYESLEQIISEVTESSIDSQSYHQVNNVHFLLMHHRWEASGVEIYIYDYTTHRRIFRRVYADKNKFISLIKIKDAYDELRETYENFVVPNKKTAEEWSVKKQEMNQFAHSLRVRTFISHKNPLTDEFYMNIEGTEALMNKLLLFLEREVGRNVE